MHVYVLQEKKKQATVQQIQSSACAHGQRNQNAHFKGLLAIILFYFFPRNHSINHMLVNMSSFAIHLILTHHTLPIILMCSQVFLHFKPVSLGFSIRNNHFLQMITIYSGQNLFYPNDQFLMLSWVAFYNIVEFSHVQIQITHCRSLSCSWNRE